MLNMFYKFNRFNIFNQFNLFNIFKIEIQDSGVPESGVQVAKEGKHPATADPRDTLATSLCRHCHLKL